MKKKKDRNTRFFIDLNLSTNKVISWNYGQRDKLVQVLPEPKHRIFLTEGQYNKFERAMLDAKGSKAT